MWIVTLPKNLSKCNVGYKLTILPEDALVTVQYGMTLPAGYKLSEMSDATERKAGVPRGKPIYSVRI